MKSYLLNHSFQCAGELVGARCWFAVAANAFEACDYIFGLHTLRKFSHALCVAAATTDKLHSRNYIILVKLDYDSLRTYTLCGVNNLV